MYNSLSQTASTEANKTKEGGIIDFEVFISLFVLPVACLNKRHGLFHLFHTSVNSADAGMYRLHRRGCHQQSVRPQQKKFNKYEQVPEGNDAELT